MPTTYPTGRGFSFCRDLELRRPAPGAKRRCSGSPPWCSASAGARPSRAPSAGRGFGSATVRCGRPTAADSYGRANTLTGQAKEEARVNRASSFVPRKRGSPSGFALRTSRINVPPHMPIGKRAALRAALLPGACGSLAPDKSGCPPTKRAPSFRCGFSSPSRALFPPCRFRLGCGFVMSGARGRGRGGQSPRKRGGVLCPLFAAAFLVAAVG